MLRQSLKFTGDERTHRQDEQRGQDLESSDHHPTGLAFCLCKRSTHKIRPQLTKDQEECE